MIANKFLKCLFFSLMIILVSACSKDDSEENNSNATGQIEFSINFSDTNIKSLKSSSDNIASVIVSINKKDGTVVFDKKEVKLLNMNGYYIASPISLTVGEYLLTEFLVTDDSNNIIYATPLKESTKAYLVDIPLSIEFEVSRDETFKLVPDVINIGESSPADFGYSTLSFNLVSTSSFNLSTFVYNSSILNFELCSAELEIKNEDAILYSGSLEAITNTIQIKSDVSTYEMTITKNGYKTFNYSFTSDSLNYYNIENENEPLKIVLVEDTETPVLPLEFIRVEGGTFQMGSENGESFELPIHKVTVSAFEIGKYEVTQAQFIKFLNDINCNSNGQFSDTEFGTRLYIDMNDLDCAIGYFAGQFYFKGSKMIPSIDCPANEITWYGADAYCKWAGGRLPYEAEWEFAARGGNKSNGFTYSGSNVYDEVAWNILNDGGETHPVGQKQANELGIHDMSGNVYEWCFDKSGVYPSNDQTNPTGATTGSYHIRRGGGWNSNFIYCRTTFRLPHFPYDSNNDDGIRVVKSIY